MNYKKVPPPENTEMTNFDPVVDYKPPPKPFDDKDDVKENRNRAKETRISIALIVLTFLASVCVLFGTLFPELSRGEVDMRPWREILASSARQQTFLIRDRVTLVNLGLWRYCYDDQLYDLVEIINPQISYRGRRDTEETEIHSIEKRQQGSEGDIAVRCHPIPYPWKMPYHVKNKTEATKVCLIIGVVACILAFLCSILVLITRLPILKLLQLLFCFIGAASGAVAIGICLSETIDDDGYTRSFLATYAKLYGGQAMENAFGTKNAEYLYGIMTGIDYNTESNIESQFGVCSLLIVFSTAICSVGVGLAELHRHVSSKF